MLIKNKMQKLKLFSTQENVLRRGFKYKFYKQF